MNIHQYFDFPWMDVTRLSREPLRQLQDNIQHAIDQYEIENEVQLSEQKEEQIFLYFQCLLEDFEENGKVSDLLHFMDNLLINYDYDSAVKEVVEEM